MHNKVINKTHLFVVLSCKLQYMKTEGGFMTTVMIGAVSGKLKNNNKEF